MDFGILLVRQLSITANIVLDNGTKLMSLAKSPIGELA